MEFDLVHMWAAMGLVAKGVAVCLVVMCIISFVITVERVLTYNKASSQSLMLAERVGSLLAEGQMQDAIALAGDEQYKTSYLGPIVAQGLTAFMTRQSRRGADSVDAAHRAIDKAVQLEGLAIRKGISMLATVASTAPFVGLFGTVFGIINAFQSMGQSGAGGIGAVSAGIAEALITTAFGLFVAIPATWAFNYFLGRIETINTEMTVSTTELLDFCVSQQENSN